MEIYNIINTLMTIVLGGGWFIYYRANKRKAEAEAKQAEENAKQQEADAFKSMQDAYQQTLEDVKNTLEEVRCERDHYREERNGLRKENSEMRQKYIEIEDRMNEMNMQYKQDVARLGRRLDCLSPFLCGVAGCMHRTKVSLMEEIDDNSFATKDSSENSEHKEQ